MGIGAADAGRDAAGRFAAGLANAFTAALFTAAAGFVVMIPASKNIDGRSIGAQPRI